MLDSHVYDTTQRALFQTLHRDDHDLWYAETPLPLSNAQVSDPSLWTTPPRKLNKTRIFPTFNAAKMTVAPQTPHPATYTKKLDLLSFGLSLFDPPWLRDITAREIETCEVLRQHPYANTCHYHGVVVHHNLVTGLVFDRYNGTLSDMLDPASINSISIPSCIRDITAGLMHLHRLGFVHCDIKPDNIFVDAATQRYVVGDFDAVHRRGEQLRWKCGTVGWVPTEEDTEIAEREIDWYSVDMIGQYLEARKRGERFDGEEVRTSVILKRARRELMEGVRTPNVPDGAEGVGGDEDKDEDEDEDVMDESW